MIIALLLMSFFAADVERMHGAVRTQAGRVLTWGAKLTEWTVSPVRSRVVREGPFGEGGCLTDLDGDGEQEFVSVRGTGLADLVWLPLGSAVEERIDGEVDMSDCLGAELFGRRGLLMIHRGAQVRFYERVAAGRWRSRDIYSIYTPSYQRGLALADVNGDGRVDIFCGNYWIASPGHFEESWRLFAIHTWFEEPDSAAVRTAVISPRRIAAAQARVSPARFAMFDARADPRQDWTATAVPHRLGRIKALAFLEGRLIAGGDGGLMVDGDLVSRDAVDALVPIGQRRLFVIGPQGAAVVRYVRPRR